MARQTHYIVQAFKSGRGTSLTAETPIQCRSPEVARRRAENLVLTRAGVVAFATSGDPELGDYDDEPVVIFKAGRLPPTFQDG
jgi:hypothetical protein